MSDKNHGLSSIYILEALLVKAMKVDFHAWFKTHYNSNVGCAFGSSESLFDDKCETGGPPKKRQRTSYAPPCSQYVPALVTTVHSVSVLFKSDNPLYEKTAKTIQRWWVSIRQWAPRNSTEEDDGSHSKPVLKWNKRIILCPITLDAIPKNDCVKIVTPEGKVWVYTLTSLLDYFRETADYRCPLTRFEFDLPRIKYIKHRAFNLGIPAFTLVQDYHRRDLAKQQKLEHENAISGLESICGELFAEAINQLALGVDQMLVNIETMILPEWKSHLRILAGMDKERCINMLNIEKTRLTELIQRPRENALHINSSWLQYLKTQVEDEILYINMAFPDANRHIHTPVGQPVIHNNSNASRRNRPYGILPDQTTFANTEPSFTELMRRYMNNEDIPIGSASGRVSLNRDQFPSVPNNVSPPSFQPLRSSPFFQPHQQLRSRAPFARPAVGVDLQSLSQLR